jgi:hypothetical protein
MRSGKEEVGIIVYDAVTPQVYWMAPVQEPGDIYVATYETIELEVEVVDDLAISLVRFKRWNEDSDDPSRSYFVELGTFDSPPFRLRLDTRELNPGWNEINAEAYDSSGNYSGATFFWIRLIPIYQVHLLGVYN